MDKEVKLILSNKGMENLILKKFSKIIFSDAGYNVKAIKSLGYQDQWEITLEEKTNETPLDDTDN